MTAIAVQGTGLRHVRKTVTFTGGAGAGQLSSDITLFTTTGRVIVEYCTAWAASAWTCAAPNLTSFLIDAAGNDFGTIINVSNINGPNAGSVWVDPNESGNGLAMPAQNNGPIAVTGNVVLRFGDMGGGANVTAGSVIVDIWYRPITNDGALAGDDIDTELVAAIWAAGTRTLTAIDEDSTTLDLDATIRAALGMAAADLDTQLTNIDNFVDDLETRVGTPSNFGSGATVAANLVDLETLVDDLEARIGTPANLGGGATIAQNLSDIEAQTDDIGAAGAGLTAIPTIAAVTTVTNLTNAPTAGDLTATMKASVNAEVLDVLNTDTFAEPGQGNPPATATLVQKIGYLYKAWRNRSTVTSSEYALYADNGTTKDQEAAVSDDGTTFERAEIQTGA